MWVGSERSRTYFFSLPWIIILCVYVTKNSFGSHFENDTSDPFLPFETSRGEVERGNRDAAARPASDTFLNTLRDAVETRVKTLVNPDGTFILRLVDRSRDHEFFHFVEDHSDDILDILVRFRNSNSPNDRMFAAALTLAITDYDRIKGTRLSLSVNGKSMPVTIASARTLPSVGSIEGSKVLAALDQMNGGFQTLAEKTDATEQAPGAHSADTQEDRKIGDFNKRFLRPRGRARTISGSGRHRVKVTPIGGGQKTGVWCWACAGAWVLKLLGFTKVKQEDVVKRVKGRVANEELYGGEEGRYWSTIQRFGVRLTRVRLTEVPRHLYRGEKCIIFIPGHVMAFVGANKQKKTVSFYDPMGPFENRGSLTEFPQSQLRNGRLPMGRGNAPVETIRCARRKDGKIALDPDPKPPPPPIIPAAPPVATNPALPGVAELPSDSMVP